MLVASKEQGQLSGLLMVTPPTSQSIIWETEYKAKIIVPEHINLSKSRHLSESQFPCHVTFISRFVEKIKRNLNGSGDKPIKHKAECSCLRIETTAVFKLDPNSLILFVLELGSMSLPLEPEWDHDCFNPQHAIGLCEGM